MTGRAGSAPGAPSRLGATGQPPVQRGAPTLAGTTGSRTGQPGGPRATGPAGGRLGPGRSLSRQDGAQHRRADATDPEDLAADPWAVATPTGLIESSEPERPAPQSKPIEPTG